MTQKISSILIITLVLACFVFLMTSCKEKKEDTNVSISGPTLKEDTNVSVNGPTLKWEEFSEKKLADLKGQPVVVMFWADWCPDCIHIKKEAFSNPKVIEKSKGINLLQVDCTDKKDSNIKVLQIKYGGDCVPTFIFFNREGEIEPNWKLVEPRTAEELIFRFEKYNKKK